MCMSAVYNPERLLPIPYLLKLRLAVRERCVSLSSFVPMILQQNNQDVSSISPAFHTTLMVFPNFHPSAWRVFLFMRSLPSQIQSKNNQGTLIWLNLNISFPSLSCAIKMLSEVHPVTSLIWQPTNVLGLFTTSAMPVMIAWEQIYHCCPLENLSPQA